MPRVRWDRFSGIIGHVQQVVTWLTDQGRRVVKARVPAGASCCKYSKREDDERS